MMESGYRHNLSLRSTETAVFMTGMKLATNMPAMFDKAGGGGARSLRKCTVYAELYPNKYKGYLFYNN